MPVAASRCPGRVQNGQKPAQKAPFEHQKLPGRRASLGRRAGTSRGSCTRASGASESASTGRTPHAVSAPGCDARCGSGGQESRRRRRVLNGSLPGTQHADLRQALPESPLEGPHVRRRAREMRVAGADRARAGPLWSHGDARLDSGGEPGRDDDEAVLVHSHAATRLPSAAWRNRSTGSACHAAAEVSLLHPASAASTASRSASTAALAVTVCRRSPPKRLHVARPQRHGRAAGAEVGRQRLDTRSRQAAARQLLDDRPRLFSINYSLPVVLPQLTTQLIPCTLLTMDP